MSKIKYPLVDVITATIGRKTLHSCLAAVAAQSYPDTRHVVISDGPFAGDWDLIKWWRKRRGNRFIFHELKKPQRRAGNGAKEWWFNHEDCAPIFRFLDDDDWIPPHSIATQVEPLLLHPKIVLVICEMFGVTSSKDGVRIFRSFKVPGKMARGQVGNGSVMVRTEIARGTVYPEVTCSDFHWIEELAKKGEVNIIPLPLYYYMQEWRPWRGTKAHY